MTYSSEIRPIYFSLSPFHELLYRQCRNILARAKLVVPSRITANLFLCLESATLLTLHREICLGTPYILFAPPSRNMIQQNYFSPSLPLSPSVSVSCPTHNDIQQIFSSMSQWPELPLGEMKLQFFPSMRACVPACVRERMRACVRAYDKRRVRFDHIIIHTRCIRFYILWTIKIFVTPSARLPLLAGW